MFYSILNEKQLSNVSFVIFTAFIFLSAIKTKFHRYVMHTDSEDGGEILEANRKSRIAFFFPVIVIIDLLQKLQTMYSIPIYE